MKRWFLRTSLPKLLLLFGCPVIICINFLLLTLSTPDQLDQLYLPTTSAPSNGRRRSPPVLEKGPPPLVPPKDVPGAFISLDDSSKCLDTMSHTRASQKAGLFQCHYQGGTQSWTWSSEYGALRNEQSKLCLCENWILCDCEKNEWNNDLIPHVLFRLSYVPKMDRDPMSKYDFNERVSAALGPHRSSYPDLRHSTCKSDSKNLRDNRKLLSTTVIICFVDEEFNTLLRTWCSSARGSVCGEA